jgi:putative cardiolipin synthase
MCNSGAIFSQLATRTRVRAGGVALRRRERCALLVLAGCVGLPQHVRKNPERGHPADECHRPRRTGAAGRGRQSRSSGIRLLSSGEEAFDSLVALADHAERTLDIQYYIITAG